jgi:hypothetical protein
MKKTSFAVSTLLLSAVLFAGCLGTKTEPQEEFTIATCNDYVKLMRCVAEKSNGGTGATAAIDQAVVAWKALSESELTQTCDMAMGAVTANATAYTQLGCEVPTTPATNADAAITDTGVTDTAVTNPADAVVVETGNVADAAVVEAVVNEVTSGVTETVNADTTIQ